MVPVRTSTTFKGDDWIGLKMRDASVVRGIGVLPVFAGLIGLLAADRLAGRTWADMGATDRRSDAKCGTGTETISIFPIRPDQARHAIEGAGRKFGHQQPRRIDRSRHFHLPFRNALEA